MTRIFFKRLKIVYFGSLLILTLMFTAIVNVNIPFAIFYLFLVGCYSLTMASKIMNLEKEL